MHRERAPVVIVFQRGGSRSDVLECHIPGIDYDIRERPSVGETLDRKCRRSNNRLTRPVEADGRHLVLKIVRPNSFCMCNSVGRGTPGKQWRLLKGWNAIDGPARVHPGKREERGWRGR